MNIGRLFKDEILKLSRRVVRREAASLRKDVAALKRQAAAGKRELAALRRDNAGLIEDLRARLSAPPAAPAKDARQARLSPRLIRALRARLGLPREAFAKLVGVSAGAIITWESGKSKPREAAKAALVALRGLGRREARWRLKTLEGSAPSRRRAS
ncbi:MAG: helix-turn-helix domain-containing protein [Elusimicrobia bacterium]|nr:helix-turn-helix domain-containing protein [Elusimicrobiota bacterium]